MATYATLTIPVLDIIGSEFNASRANVWIEPNVPVVLADSIRVGGRREQVVNGVATFANLVTTNSADNPASFGYIVTITAPPKGARAREDIVVLTTSDFPFTATANLKDIPEAWDNITAPVSWRSEFLEQAQDLLDAQVAIAGPVDATVQALVKNTGGVGPLTSAALSATVKGDLAAGQGGALNATLRRLSDDIGNVKILVIGDSTASSPSDQWPEDLLVLLRATYPTYTVRRLQWDNTTKVYGTATQVGATGTGANFIDVYSGGVGGTIPESNMASWETYVGAVQPHLTIVHFGHNYGKDAAGAGVASNAAMDEQFRERMLRLALRIRTTCPESDIILNSQNPYLTAGARTGVSTVRAQIIRSIAADLGCAYGPICEAFIATGNPTVYLQGDLLHPTTSGATDGALLSAQTVMRLLAPGQNPPPSGRTPSPLLVPGRQLLLNADFASFASPPTLTSWTASNSTLAKQTTQYESRNAYSLSITATGASFATAFQTLPIRQAKGQIVTVGARAYVPTASSVEAGRVGITGDGGLVAAKSAGMTNLKDQWAWVFATARVPDAATFVTVSLFGGAGAADVAYFDRVSAVVGHLPRDIA